MKKLINTPLILGLILFHFNLNAQLFSSGNNVIAGNKVGIGTNSPTAMLEIETTYDPTYMSCPTCIPYTPIKPLTLRLDYINTGSTVYDLWDFDLTDGLTISKFESISSSASKLLSLNEDISYMNGDKIRLDNKFEASKESYGLFFGFGAKRVGYSWSTQPTIAKAAAVQISSNGDFRITTGISPYSISGNNAFTVTHDKKIGIGTVSPQAQLEVKGDVLIDDGRFVIADASGTNKFEIKPNGYVIAREILVDMNETIPDYVFADDYPLMSLSEVRLFVENENHLPNIPSAEEYEKLGGIEVGELSRLLLEKQEELLLYILQLEDRLMEVEQTKE